MLQLLRLQLETERSERGPQLEKARLEAVRAVHRGHINLIP
jgi:hypothetical protein